MSRKLQCFITVCIALLLGIVLPCEASEGGGFNRHTWDLTMRFINFGILAFVLYKYGKDPLVNFLKGRCADIGASFDDIAEQKQLVGEEQAKQEQLFDELDDKIKKIKGYYEQVGQEEKNKILAEAETACKMIMVDAEVLSLRELETAKKQFRAEVVELAVQLAEQRIVQNITTEDHSSLVDRCVHQLKSTNRSQLSV